LPMQGIGQTIILKFQYIMW